MSCLCVNCSTEMNVKKTGAVVKYRKGHYRSGDLYECGGCGNEVITGLSNSYQNWACDNDPSLVDIDMEN